MKGSSGRHVVDIDRRDGSEDDIGEVAEKLWVVDTLPAGDTAR
jgi:hypothetical protein